MLKSFKYAFRGVADALKSEPNLRIHFLVAVIVFVLAFLLGFNYLELAILALVVTMVITLELINTNIEKMVNIIMPEIDEKARIIKDISAAIVLFGAVCSIIVGVFLFLPKFL